MQFILRIRTEGAAFAGADDDYGPGPEVARILRKLAEDLDHPQDVAEWLKMSGRVHDLNGTTCGRWAAGTGDWDAVDGLLLPELQEISDGETLAKVRQRLRDGEWSGVMYDGETLAAICELVGVDRQD